MLICLIFLFLNILIILLNVKGCHSRQRSRYFNLNSVSFSTIEIASSRDTLKIPKKSTGRCKDKGVQTGSFSLQAAAACTCRPSTFFFLTPMTGNPRDDRPAIVSVDLRYRRRGRFIKVSIPTHPSRMAPARLTKYYNAGRPNALVCRWCLDRVRVP